MAKSVGNKLAPFLNEIIPLLSGFMSKIDPEQSVDIDNELSEACLTTIQSIVHKCPADIKGSVE